MQTNFTLEQARDAEFHREKYNLSSLNKMNKHFAFEKSFHSYDCWLLTHSVSVENFLLVVGFRSTKSWHFSLYLLFVQLNAMWKAEQARGGGKMKTKRRKNINTRKLTFWSHTATPRQISLVADENDSLLSDIFRRPERLQNPLGNHERVTVGRWINHKISVRIVGW